MPPLSQHQQRRRARSTEQWQVDGGAGLARAAVTAQLYDLKGGVRRLSCQQPLQRRREAEEGQEQGGRIAAAAKTGAGADEKRSLYRDGNRDSRERARLELNQVGGNDEIDRSFNRKAIADKS